MKKLILILTIVFIHTTVFAQNNPIKEKVSEKATINSVGNPSVSNINNEKIFSKRSEEMIETASTVYNELMPLLVFTINKNNK